MSQYRHINEKLDAQSNNIVAESENNADIQLNNNGDRRSSDESISISMSHLSIDQYDKIYNSEIRENAIE